MPLILRGTPPDSYWEPDEEEEGEEEEGCYPPKLSANAAEETQPKHNSASTTNAKPAQPANDEEHPTPH